MTDQPPDDTQRRDDLLLRLLKTPPKPRPKRERGKADPIRDPEKPATDEKPAPSA